MALLPILRYPDPRLHTKAKPVAVVDDRIRQLAADMAETMYEAPGIGLAATQVNVHEQLIVMHASEERSEPRVFVDPEVIARDATGSHQEGCLSVPGIYETVKRSRKVRVRALGLDGRPFELDAEDILAVCVQHEMDHLQGKVFVEYLSMLKQNRIKAKLAKKARITA